MPLCARQVEALERHRVCFSPLADEFCGEHGDNTKAGGILYAGGEQMNKAVLMQKVTRGAPSTLVDNSEGPLVQTAVHPCLMTPLGGSRGSARAYWPEITAPAARKLAVALAARSQAAPIPALHRQETKLFKATSLGRACVHGVHFTRAWAREASDAERRRWITTQRLSAPGQPKEQDFGI